MVEWLARNWFEVTVVTILVLNLIVLCMIVTRICSMNRKLLEIYADLDTSIKLYVKDTYFKLQELYLEFKFFRDNYIESVDNYEKHWRKLKKLMGDDSKKKEE